MRKAFLTAAHVAELVQLGPALMDGIKWIETEIIKRVRKGKGEFRYVFNANMPLPRAYVTHFEEQGFNVSLTTDVDPSREIFLIKW